MVIGKECYTFMIKMPAVFSNHMILQRNKEVLLWGTSDKSWVKVRLCKSINQESDCVNKLDDNQEHTKMNDQEEMQEQAAEQWEINLHANNNDWKLKIPPYKEGGPYELCIYDEDSELTFTDIYFGEVWLAGGQSNMEFEIHKCDGGEKILADMNSKVRYYHVSRIPYVGEELQKAEEENHWMLFGDEGTENWSAVAYFFADKIATKLNCKVGIIGCNWGGTSASCWIPRETMLKHPDTKVYTDEYDKVTEGQIFEEYLKELADYKAYQSVFEKHVAEYYQTAENPTWEEALSLFGENLYPGPMGPRNERRPGGLYESMLQRVMPYTIAGFLFYQAEEDDHRPYTYETLLKALIRKWREDWSDENMPFLYVLLPMFADIGVEDFKNWAFLREAQINISQEVSDVGLASALEYGEYGNIHPTNKKPVGERLANIALEMVYENQGNKKETNGKEFSYKEHLYGPKYKECYVKDNHMYLVFDGIKDRADWKNKTMTKNEDGITTEHLTPIRNLMEIGTSDIDWGFEIAGSDGIYYVADTTFADGQKGEIILSSSKVQTPVFARYLWTNYHDVILFGPNGIPLSPFRTSDRDGAVATGSRQGIIHNKEMK